MSRQDRPGLRSHFSVHGLTLALGLCLASLTAVPLGVLAHPDHQQAGQQGHSTNHDHSQGSQQGH